MHEPNAMLMKAQATLSNSTLCWRTAARCRVITYLSAISAASVADCSGETFSPDLNRTESPDWRPLISPTEMLNRGDRYEARRLYLYVDRVAYWQKIGY